MYNLLGVLYNIKNVIGKLKKKKKHLQNLSFLKIHVNYKYKNKKHHFCIFGISCFLQRIFFCTKTINFVDCYHNEHFHQVWFQLADGIILEKMIKIWEVIQTMQRKEANWWQYIFVCFSHNPLGQDRWVQNKLVVHSTSKSLLRLICYKKKKRWNFIKDLRVCIVSLEHFCKV